MVQSPSNRLLTEAAGALAFRTAAQVDTQADARVAAMLTAQKNKPSGLAPLGADGIVPAVNLPAASAGVVSASLAADVRFVYNAAMADILSVSLGVGLWLVEVTGSALVNNTSSQYYLSGQLIAAGGLVVAPSGTAAGASGQMTNEYVNNLSNMVAQTSVWNGAPYLAVGTGGYRTFRMRVALNVTTAGVLKFQGASGGGDFSQAVGIGTRLRAEKL